MRLEDYICTHKDWEEKLSSAPYNLTIRHLGAYTLFMYNHYDSDMNEPIVQEARGCIFREDTCVCRAMDKFFNYGEPQAAQIDWSSAKVLEKIDGSLMKVWHDKGQWHLSSNGMIDAFEDVFGKLFEKALREYGYDDFLSFAFTLDPNFCYWFELATQDNVIVVPHKGYHIYSLGMRDVVADVEVPFEEVQSYFPEFEHPKMYQMNKIEDVIAAANELSYDNEGYVVVDKYFHRIKIKSPKYIRMFYANDDTRFTIRTILKIILAGEEAEIINYFPERKEQIENIKKQMEGMKESAQAAVKKYYSVPTPTLRGAAVHEPKYVLGYIYKERLGVSWEEYTSHWEINKWKKELEGFVCE